jgi:hypothetical protein
MKKTTAFVLWTLLISVCGGLSAQVKNPATTITVDPFTRHVVNGVGEIQAMNGLAVNGESRMEQVNETRELNPSTFKLFLYVKPLDIHWKIVKEKQKTRAGCEELQAMLEKVDFDKKVSAWFDKALAIDPKTGRRIPGKRYSAQFQQLEQLQAWGTRRNVVLYFAQPHPVTEKVFPAYSRYFNACVKEVKKRFPDLGPLYVMLFNEPDYEYPRRWEEQGIAESLTFFYQFHNYVDAHLKKEFPDVTLIGPGISRFMDWRSWQNWSVPFLQQVPQARHFNCQPYCRRFTDLLSWSEMLQAESLKINGKRVPLVMSEANMGGMHSPATEWWKDEFHVQRIFDEARGMFGFMNHPDQFAMKHFFIYHYKHKFADMWYEQDGVVKNTPVYWLYWLMRDIKGTKCFGSVNRESSPLKIISAKDGKTVTLAVFNESMEPASANLDMRWPDGILAPPCVVEYLRYDSTAKTFRHGVEPGQHFPDSLLLAPGEVKKLRWVYSPTKEVTIKSLEEKEFFAPNTAVIVREAPQTLSIDARRPGPNETARLRFSLYLDDILAVDRIRWTLNQHEMEAKFAPEAYDEGRVPPIIHVDCAVPSTWLEKSNEISFAPLSDCSYRVMFSSLVFRPQPESFPSYARSDAFQKEPTPIALEMNLPRFVEPGEQELILKVANTTDASQTARLTLHIPEGWRVSNFPSEVKLAAKERRKIVVKLALPAGGMRRDGFVTATLSAPNQADMSIRRGAAYQVPFQAEYTPQAPVIDGEIGEWNPASFIRENHQGPGVKSPFKTRLATKWDEKHLYLAVEVDGRKLDALPRGADNWWKHDTLELFLDFGNAKKPSRDHRTMQVWIALKDLALNGSKWGTVPNDPNGCMLKGTSPDSFQVNIVERDNGFSLEASLDWEALSSGWEGSHERFTPTPGTIVGCEATLASRSLIGSKVKAYASPAKWGNLKLLKKRESVTRQTEEITLDTSLKEKKADAPSASRKPARFSFGPLNTSQWKFPAKAKLDEAGLHLVNNHSALLLNQPIENALTGQGLKLSITLDGFETIGTSSKPLRTHARIFLAPQQEKGNEPYVMKDMICLVVAYKQYGDATITLYKKSAPAEKNWGRILWSGAIALDQFPISLSLQLNETTYRVGCDKTLAPVGGSLSGQHGLSGKLWKEPLRFGIKSCFGSRPGAVIIRTVDIYDGKQ